MSQKQTKTKKTKKTVKVGRSRYSLIIIVLMLVLIAFPLYILGDIIYNAYIGQGSPIVGERFEGDLDPAITEANRSDIKEALEAYEEVEKVTITMQTSQLKVYVDIKDDVLSENYQPLIERAYATIQEVLPVETYFSSTDNQRMYDLELSMFNVTSRPTSEEAEFIFFNLVKNSSMEEPIIQDIANAKNQEVADRIRYEQALKDLEGQLPTEPVEEPANNG